jgi:hypothetical protein
MIKRIEQKPWFLGKQTPFNVPNHLNFHRQISQAREEKLEDGSSVSLVV